MAQAPGSYNRQQHGWETTSHDYHVHVSTMERTPSVLTDVPRYPNVHRVLNNKVAHAEPQERAHKPTKPEKNVKIVDKEQVIFQDNSNSGGNCEFVEESIDVETDGFLKQKHKGFELCKWKTFKYH